MLNLDAATIQQLNAPEVSTFYLYEIDYADTEAPLRWTSWDEPVLYNSLTWNPQTIRHSEVTTNSDGSISPVTMLVGNLDSDRLIQQAIEQYNLVGRKVTIIQLLSGGSHIITFEYRITGARATKGQVNFTLAVGFDIFNIRIPGRRMLAQFCAWQFGDENCSYTPATGEECEKTWQDCKKKGNTQNFGGYPGINNNFIIL